jgi:hypothetical protein
MDPFPRSRAPGIFSKSEYRKKGRVNDVKKKKKTLSWGTFLE